MSLRPFNSNLIHPIFSNSLKSLFKTCNRFAVPLVPLFLQNSKFSSNRLNTSNISFSRKGKDKHQGGKGKGKGKEDDDAPQQEMDWNAAKSTIENPLTSLRKEFENLRVSRASPSILEKVGVETENGRVSLGQLGQVSIKDSQTLHINLYDEQHARDVEKAIREAKLELSPQTEGNIIKVKTPKITTEYRESLVKLASKHSEQAKVAVRNARKNVLDTLKKCNLPEDATKKGEKKIQQLVDEAIKNIDSIFKAKEKEITSL